jgi:dUTPase
MEKTITETGLSPEQVERIKAAQKRHSAVDPGCENLTPEEFINWHPVGGISWEERARRMKAAGVIDSDLESLDRKKIPALAIAEN